jgi:protein-tyrosine phosphatase
MSYVDLHLHLLPGVDDGSPDEQTALAYARRLADEGVREVTATPHVCTTVPLDIATIPQRVAELQRAIDARGLGVSVHTGGEIHPLRVPSLSAAELAIVAQGPPGSRWLLVEAPFDGIDDRFAAVCEHLRAAGYGLLIAHPERAAGLIGGPGMEILTDQLAAGAVLQVNVCSLLGNHGLQAQEAGVQLLRNGYVYALASDAHPGSREHTLRLGFALALRAGASSIQAWRLTQANPRFLLHQGIPQAASPATAAALALSLD